MANDQRIRAGTTISTISFAGSDAQFENTILDYCEARGIDTAGSKQAILDRFNQDRWDDVRAVAKAHRRRKKQAAAGTAIDAEVDSELGT